MGMMQRPEESLQAYLNRFDAVARQVDEFEDGVATTSLLRGMRDRNMVSSLFLSEYSCYKELRRNVQKRINAEAMSRAIVGDLQTGMTGNGRAHGSGSKQHGKLPSINHHNVPNHYHSGGVARTNKGVFPNQGRPHEPPERFSAPRRYQNLTPLAVSAAEVYVAIRGRDTLVRPPPIKTDNARKDPTKFCMYHEDRGHTTEECRFLRNLIEGLVRRGELKHFLKENNQGPREGNTFPAQARRASPPRQPPPPPPPPGAARVIHMISGGQARAGSSNRARKDYARQARFTPEYVSENKRPRAQERGPDWAMTFTAADVDRVLRPHDDALVISVWLGSSQIKRVLVDTGAAVDIMFESAFTKLGFTQNSLRGSATTLVGFTGDTILATGAIDLYLTMGTRGPYKSVSTTCMVVRCPSVYNMIMGRPMLNKLAASIFMLGLVLKVPTENRCFDVQGDQREARECYYAETRGLESLSEEDLQPEGREDKVNMTAEAETIFLRDEERPVQIGRGLSKEEKDDMVKLQREN